MKKILQFLRKIFNYKTTKPFTTGGAIDPNENDTLKKPQNNY